MCDLLFHRQKALEGADLLGYAAQLGLLDPTLLSAFPAVAARQVGAHTLLTGLLDQSALFGVLAEAEALGLYLLEVRHGTSPEPGDDSPSALMSSPHPGDPGAPPLLALRIAC